MSDRDEKGQFTKGNTGGPGNPYARHTAGLRKAITDNITNEGIAQVVATLQRKAIEGDTACIRMYLAWAGGKPHTPPNPDTLDANEIRTLRENIVKHGDLESVFEGMAASMFCQLARVTLPLMNKQRGRTLGAQLRKGLPPDSPGGESAPPETPPRPKPSAAPVSDPYCPLPIGDRPGMQPSALWDTSFVAQKQSQKGPQSAAPPSENGDLSEDDAAEREVKARMFAILEQRIKEARQSLGLPPITMPSDPQSHPSIGDCPVMQPSTPNDSTSARQNESHSATQGAAPPSANGDLREQEAATSESHAPRRRLAKGEESGRQANLPARPLPSSDPHCHASIGDCPETPPSASIDSAREAQQKCHSATQSAAPPSANGDLSDEEAIEKEVKARMFAILEQRIKEARQSLGLPPITLPVDPQGHASIGDCPETPPSALNDSAREPQKQSHTVPKNAAPPSANGDFSGA